MTVKSLTRSSLENNVFYRSMLAGNPGEEESDVWLGEVVLGSNQTSVTFDVSPYAGQYKHLQLRIVARTLRAGTDDGLQLTFNGTSSSNAVHFLVGNGSSVYAQGAGNEIMQVAAYSMTAANSPANVFGAAVLDILDAFSTNKFKTVRSLSGKTSDTSVVSLQSTSWNNAAALTSIKIDSRNGNNGFAQYSRFSLYGVK